MRELSREKTISEVYGYEAFDGKIFKSEDECKKYEDSAEGVIRKDFQNVIENKLSENELFDGYGCGCDDYKFTVVDIKDVNTLEIVNRYLKIRGITDIKPEFIGEKVIFSIGFESDKYVNAPVEAKTMDSMVKKFIRDMEKVFGEEYTLDQMLKARFKSQLKSAIEFYEKDCYTAEDMYHMLQSIYETLN